MPEARALSPALPLRCQSCGLVARDRAGTCTLKSRRASPGESLFADGEIVFMRRGLAVIASTGAEPCPALRGPNSMLGLEAITERPVRYTAHALTDVALCAASASAFRKSLGDLDSPLGTALMLTLRESSRRNEERQALEGTAVQRVARFLTQATRENASPPAIPLAVLSGTLGMRPETLSRALAELRKRGALARDRKIRILDAERLRDAAL